MADAQNCIKDMLIKFHWKRMFFTCGSMKAFCLVWAIGGSEMLVGTVMASGESVHIYVKFGIRKPILKFKVNIVSCDVKIPNF